MNWPQQVSAQVTENQVSRQQLYFMYNGRKAERKVLCRKFVLVFSVILALLWNGCFVPEG